MGNLGEDIAVYLRISDPRQDEEHQRDDIESWLEDRSLGWGDVEIYAEDGSGAEEDRGEFTRLTDDVEDGKISDVIVWELSRIAREPYIGERFLKNCEDNDVTIHITDGLIPEIKPEWGIMRVMASFAMQMAKQERERMISRVKSGMNRARREGKWLGGVPTGFVRSEDGYLKPNLDPDYDEDETGFMDVVNAIEAVEDGMSVRKAAEATPNTTRWALSKILDDEDRRAWYVDHEAEDERVQEALDELAGT